MRAIDHQVVSSVDTDQEGLGISEAEVMNKIYEGKKIKTKWRVDDESMQTQRSTSTFIDREVAYRMTIYAVTFPREYECIINQWYLFKYSA